MWVRGIYWEIRWLLIVVVGLRRRRMQRVGLAVLGWAGHCAVLGDGTDSLLGCSMMGSGPFLCVPHREWHGGLWDAVDEDGDVVRRFGARYVVGWGAPPSVAWLCAA